MLKFCHVFTLALCLILLCGARSYGSDKPEIRIPDDRELIYAKFLDKWLGPPGVKSINLANIADIPDSREIETYRDCIKNSKLEELTETRTAFSFSGTSIEHRRNIHLINRDLWEPSDPWDAIGDGKPVEQALRKGFADGLLTLSQIMFDEQHKIAVFSYSFSCGSLCGNGSAVMFLKTKAGWRQSKRSCGFWIS